MTGIGKGDGTLRPVQGVRCTIVGHDWHPVQAVAADVAAVAGVNNDDGEQEAIAPMLMVQAAHACGQMGKPVPVALIDSTDVPNDTGKSPTSPALSEMSRCRR